MSTQVHAEIQYTHKEKGSIHSDICPDDCSSDNITDTDYRKFLHACLDEWLDHSNGTGMFYIKDDAFTDLPMTNVE